MKNNEKKQQLLKRVYIYSLDIIKFVDTLKINSTTKIISNQLLRSATSVTANIIEAQSASSKKDFTNFYNYSLKSANETKLWIGLLRDSQKADVKECNKLLQETTELGKIVAASIITLKKK